jgi:hypothetical protein
LIFRAKSSTFKRICHPDRSEAQWRDLLFLFRFSHRIVIPTRISCTWLHP